MKLRNLALVLAAAAGLAAQADDAGVLLQRAIRKESVEGDLKGAIELYKKVVAGAAKNRAAAAKALLRLGECYEKQGNAQARRAYERLVREFSDQKGEAREAQARLAAGGYKSVVAQLIAKGSSLGLRGWLIGRVTPDGRLCTFIDQQTRDVGVRDLHTGEVRRVTNEGTLAPRGTGAATYPVPSRNGKQIAYIWRRALGQPELRMINTDGSGMRTVPFRWGSGDYFQVRDWSPDGKSILGSGYVHEPYWWGVATIDLGSGEMHRLRSLAITT
ncbi:MAG: tetratricopeptide repeat protein [Acidobacteriota bacterium]